MRVRAVGVASVVFLLSGYMTAETPVTVGIPISQFNFVSASQLHTDWCWAASVQMVLNWYNIPVRQTDVVNRIYGKPVDWAASENAIAVALSGTAYDRRDRMVHLHAERLHGTPPANVLVQEFSQRHPMLVTFRSTKTMLHAVVLTSGQYVETATGPQMTALTFRDPNPSFPDRHAAATFRVTGAELNRFLRAISSYYLLSVQN